MELQRCRTCLKQSEVSYNLFSYITIGENVLEVSTLVTSIANIQIYQTDNYPQIICDKCFNKLTYAYDFKIQCEESHRKLLNNEDFISDTKTDDIEFEEFLEMNIQENIAGRKVRLKNLQLLTPKQIVESEKIVNLNIKDLEYLNGNALIMENELDNKNDMEKIDKVVLHQRIKNDTKICQGNHSESIEVFTKSEIFTCVMCCNTFKTRRLLKSHMESHRSDKPHICGYPNCNSKFKTRLVLLKHVALHENLKNHLCSVCGKGYNTRDALSHHMKYHEEPGYKCNYCDKKFYFIFHLNSHLITHTGEKLFMCENCGGSYRNSVTFRKHIKLFCGSGKMPRVKRNRRPNINFLNFK